MAKKTFALTALFGVLTTLALAQAPVRIRGTITSIEGTTLHVTPKAGGPDASVTLTEMTP